MQIGLLGAQIAMLHPNNPAHWVETFFGHDVNPNRINTIKAQTESVRNGKMGHFRAGKAERTDRKMPYSVLLLIRALGIFNLVGMPFESGAAPKRAAFPSGDSLAL